MKSRFFLSFINIFLISDDTDCKSSLSKKSDIYLIKQRCNSPDKSFLGYKILFSMLKNFIFIQNLSFSEISLPFLSDLLRTESIISF